MNVSESNSNGLFGWNVAYFDEYDILGVLIDLSKCHDCALLLLLLKLLLSLFFLLDESLHLSAIHLSLKVVERPFRLNGEAIDCIHEIGMCIFVDEGLLYTAQTVVNIDLKFDGLQGQRVIHCHQRLNHIVI